MSTDDNIFLATSKPLGEVAGWLGEVLGLEPVENPNLKEGVYLLRGRARTVDGDVYVTVAPNVYGEVDPEPDEVSAIDHYQGVIDVRYAGPKDEDLQEREARAIFDDLVVGQPAVAIILSHNMALITAAYLPGAGVISFPRGTSLDVEDVDAWRPWVAT